MIEKTIADYLASALSVPVCMEMPETPPSSIVLVEKTAGGRKNRVNSAMLAIQSYAPSLLQAAQLNEAVKSAMENAADLAEVCSAELNTDYNFTDTASKRYRYQAVYDITHY